MKTPTVTIEGGYPAAVLSPNSNAHYMVRHRARKSQRGDWMMLAALAARRPESQWLCGYDGDVEVVITVCPPTQRRGGTRRDRDNMLGRFKAALDGIAEAFGVDDAQFVPRVVWGEQVLGGRATVALAPHIEVT